jgi:DNA-directed RNA polymerase beta subunit/intein/homing endonuclease
MMSEEHTWNILGEHFKRKGFVHHQTESFDQFINVGIHKIITEEPEIVLNSKNGKNPGSYTSYKVSFSNVYVPNPTVTEDTRVLRGFFPAEARQRDLTYDSPIYATVTETLEIDGKEPETNQHVRVVLGRIPIMLRSSKCYLTDMTPEERIQAGECKHDQGGYFLIRGKERVLVSQLRGVYNTPLVYEQRSGDKYSFSCEMRSMSEETGHSVLISAVIGVDDRTLSFSLPYIKDYIPMGVVFKAMGYRTEQFADLIGLSCEKTKKYISLIINDSFFVEEKDDGFVLFVFENQKKVADSLQVDETTADGKRRVNDKLKEMWKNENADDWKHKSTKINALKYIGQHTNHPIKESERKDYAEQVVECEIFPHMGVTSTIKEKAYLLGHMIHKLLATRLGIRKPDDRDNYINKRVESPGVLCHELFRQLFKKYIGSIIAIIEKKKQLPDAMSIIPRLTDITKGFIHCFGTGNWGVPKNSYVRQGVAQILSRLSYGATLSNLRRVSIPVGKESKNTAIRQINPSQIMYICPVETPEGAPVGIVLNLSLLTRISDRTPTVLVKEVLELCENMSSIKDFKILNEQTKVFLNGILTGVTEEPNELVEELKEMRRIKMLPWDVSISYDEVDDEVNICSDEGRLLRPVFTVKDDSIMAKETDGTNWDELVEKGLIIYIDNMEANGSVIAFTQKELSKYKSSYCEISAAMMLGVMASIIPFPDHSQCIFKDEPVYMANGTVKKICDVQVGDEVITFHPETQQQSITKVSHTYTNKTDKQLFEITTLSGRKITATFDHRFMTFDGWKRIEEIEVGKTLVGVSTEPKPVSNLVDEYVVLTKEKFIERCLNAQIEEFFVTKYASEISFPIKSTDTNLYIISRLFGFICTKSCYISFSDQGDVILNVLFTDKHSANLFNEDIERLGFKYSKKVVDFHCTEYSGAISALFIALGCNNIIQEEECKYKRLPDWIKNGSDLVKREFLSGFQGGCGSEIKHILTNKIIMGVTSKSIKTEHVDSLMDFMNDIVELLRYFNIETNNITCEKYKDIMDVSYYISSTRNNLIKYFDIVGYRYNVDKNRESGIYVEYLKYLEKKYTERLHLDKEIKSYTDTIHLDVKNGNKIKKLHNDKIKLQKGLFSPEEWINIIKWKSTTLFIPLESKIESLETIISDITTESTNQSFLCGDTFCVHNSPRNCYQCLDPETLVVMADNTKKAIKDIKIGDCVISVDPITCVQSTTTVTNQYVRETEKEIITVETESGRKITCTVDHPVLTTDGWKHAIDAENICVIPQQVVYSGGDADLYITLPETSVKEKHINDLTSIGLYPIKSTSLPILARIVGYLITNGSTGLYDKRPQVQFNFYSIEDCEDFLKDLHELGLTANKVTDVNKIIDVIFEKYGTCKQIIYNNAFASLLIGLVDGYVGKRTTQSHPRLMNWIKNGSMLVKREFLSGFQGGNKLTGVTSTKFLFNHTSLPSRVDYVNSLVEFMTEIKVLFEEFDIECSGPFLIKKSQHSQSDDVHFYFKNTHDNHINYFEKIGWRYNIFKYVESLPVYEYQKTCQKAIDDIIEERQIIKKYIEDGMTTRQISDKLNKTYQYISDSIRSIEENREPRIPNSFESWKRQVKDRAIFVKIVSKTRSVKGNMIADITTESKNHSFIAGDSFCVHNSSMGKQAMSMFALSHLTRADTVVHVLNTPQRPLVGTKAAKMMGFNDMPSGLNCIVAIACYTGFNQEDSVILNYSAVQRGLFWATTYKTHSDEEKKQGYNAEKICIPPIDRRKHDANYGLLDENGIVRLRHPKWIDEKGKIRGGDALFVKKGDVIIGKISIQSDKSGNEIFSDCSVVIGKGEEGYIDRIFSTITPNGYKLVKIVIRSLRIPEVGDKFASRAAQKGTVGMVYKQEDMPFTREGIVPDIIINPHCIPSRMTINQLIESVMGKSCTINGKYGDATPFTKESKNIAEEACKTLGMLGYESTGKEMLMNGMTGENMGMFFIGPVYYQRLKHLVSDKMHARATGPVTTLTRQPLEGRSRDGGQRFGEMERDCHEYHAPIPLNCGLSVEIGTMENKNYYVLSYDEQKQQIIPSTQSNFLSKGDRECVDVIFQDGRSIRCTDNHKILTSDNVWIPVSEMVKGVTRIKTGITNPLIIVKEEIEKFIGWKFQAGYTKIEVKDEESYFRALSFARLVGYICADGGIYQINRSKKYIGLINLGHEIDVSSALEDLGKFAMITQGNFRQKNYYRIDIPQNFVSDLMKVEGIVIGKKINQPAQLPTFITDPSCPLPIVREFLGGLFGGDGHTCVLALHRGKRDLLTSVSFSKSKCGSQLDSLEEMMKQLQTLLARFDIHNVTIQKAKETTSSKKKVDSLKENKSYQLTLHICIDDLPMFHEKIGFRYCCHKSQRLEAGASYKRLRDGVTRQHNWLVQRVDELTNFSEIKNEFPDKNVPTKKAIEKAVKDLNKTESLLHPYAIPSTHDINDHLVKGTSFGKFRGKGFPNAEEYLKDIGALDWFLQDEPVKPEDAGDSPPCEEDTTLLEGLTNLSVSYGVDRKCEGLPTMNLRVIDIRPAGVHPVYDIQVDETHTFLANGIVAHNCMIGHGVSKFLQERLFLVSDKYQVSICSKCGNFATSKTECRACDTDQVLPVKLPYVGKLVLQELNAMMLKTKITAK